MNKLILATLVTIATATSASAETYMDVTYSTPSGWTQYPGRCRGVCLLNEESKARIDIHTTGGGSPMGAVKSIIGTPNKSGEISVAGRQGAWGAGNGKVVAATAMGSSYVVFIVELSASAGESDVAGWAALVDGASMSGGESARAPAPPPSADYGHQEETRSYTIKLVNVGRGCTARMTWDGSAYDLGPGETRELTVTEGTHDLGFNNNDGSSGSARYNVPKFTTFKGGCQEQRQEQPAQHGSDDQLAQWAALLDGNTYAFTESSSGYAGDTFLGQQFRFFRADDCPSLAFQYNEVGTGAGIAIDRMVAGCAHLTGTVDGAPAGRVTVRLQGLLQSDSSGQQAINSIVYDGAFHIYTNALAVLGPFKMIKQGWKQLNKVQ
ncbi:MAG: hypothetical protein SFX73_01805 [Kofleriaceae bacterium]|nr:hypothetical protein [Kofleriaceae bacterium]